MTSLAEVQVSESASLRVQVHVCSQTLLCGSAKNVSHLILLYLFIELFIELLISRNGENVE